MKNLPNEEWINRIGESLRQHTELPDEGLWQRIWPAVQVPAQARYRKTVTRVAITLLIFTSVLLVQTENQRKAISLAQKADTIVASIDDRIAIATELKNISCLENLLNLSLTNDIHSHRVKVNQSNTRLHRADKINAENKITVLSLEDKSQAANDSQPWTDHRYSSLMASHSDKKKIGSPPHEAENLTMIFQDSIFSFDQSHPSITDTALIIIPIAITEYDSLSLEKEEQASKKEKRQQALRTYLSLAPMLSYYSITPNENDGIIVTTISTEKRISAQRLGFRAEAGLQMRFAHRWEWYAGLSYEKHNQSFRYEDHLPSEGPVIVPVGNLTFEISSARHQHTLNYQVKNAGFQAGLLYTLTSNVISHKIGGGLIYQKSDQLNTETVTEKFSSRLLMYQMSYRSEYDLKSNWTVFIQPGFAQTINVFENTAKPFKISPQKISCSFGIIYSLRSKLK